MKVYVSSHDRASANALAATLTAAGHDVVSTWHADVSPRPDISDAAVWYMKAAHNLILIDHADALVVIAAPEGCHVPGGKFVEAGAAIASRKPVAALGRVENGMMHVATLCPTTADVLAWLTRRKEM